jgi:hypothetical protein
MSDNKNRILFIENDRADQMAIEHLVKDIKR